MRRLPPYPAGLGVLVGMPVGVGVYSDSPDAVWVISGGVAVLAGIYTLLLGNIASWQNPKTSCS